MRILLNALVAVLFCFGAQAQQHVITLNLQKNQVYPQKMAMKMAVKQKLGEQELNVAVDMTSAYEYKVTDIVNDVYSMDITYTDISMNTSMPNGSHSATDVLKGMIGKTFQIKMNKQGKVVEVKNLESLFEQVFSNAGNMTPAAKKQLMEQFGTEKFKSQLEAFSGIYPNRPVAVGDVWNLKTEAAGMTMDGQYKLTGVTPANYAITGSTKMSADMETPMPNGAGAIRVVVGGNMNAELKLDRKSGWLSEGKLTQTLNGSTTMPKSEAMPNGMSIPMEMSTEISVTSN